MKGRFLEGIFLAFLTFYCLPALHAQDRPIGYWRGHLPYNNAIGVATDGQTVFAISEQAFFSYDLNTGQISSYSKVEGMADVQMSQIGYDMSTNTVILGYANSNIDLFKDNSFYNIPALKDQTFSGSKAINGIYTSNGRAYLSTGLGIVVLNLESRKVAETYVFSKANQTIGINSFTGDDTYFYAATPRGLFRANRNNPNLQAFAVWTPLDTTRSFTGLATVGQKVFVTNTDSLFVINGSSLQFLHSSGGFTTHIDAGKDLLYLSTFHPSQFYSQVQRMDMSYQWVDSIQKQNLLGNVRQTTEVTRDNYWIADAFYDYGLTRVYNGLSKQQIIPAGPFERSCFDILAYNKELWVAHGAFDDLYILKANKNGVSRFKDDRWINFRPDNVPVFTNVSDVVSLAQDPADGTVYGGTLQSGLEYFKKDGVNFFAGLIRDSILESKINEPGTIPANGVVFDQNGNLWVTQNLAADELAVRTTTGEWYHYTTPFTGGLAHGAAGIIVDDNNQKWYFSPFGSRGVIVYNDNNTPENGYDDSYAQFQQGAGAGNLPSNNILSLVKDRDGSIWVGTDNGIGIISCGYAATQSRCDAELRVVQYDQFPGYLFAGERVQAMAVDGANRKWIGTANGVWLISPDASKIIQQFNVKNSPLPSNIIQKIAVDPVTGDVYIGTDQGLVSYHYTATEGNKSNADIVTYPNPVPSGYAGTIAIRGLVTDADVRITDIAGQLIYRTKALGGQAVWNGMDYTGHRPQSGVYLIFVTNKDGSETSVGKMLFYN